VNDAKILADSVNVTTNDRLTTFLLPRFPKVLLQELNTHRMLSRNAASSRAIPIEKMIERVKADPYIPNWTANQRGMQGALIDDKELRYQGDREWLAARDNAIAATVSLMRRGIHKQNANRLLEPFIRVPVLISGTEWQNFFKLRCDAAAHPDFRSVARAMQAALDESKPQLLNPGEWHAPYFADGERDRPFDERLKIAVARAARISYSTHDGKFDLEKDITLHDRLLESGHMSPFEHCAIAVCRAYLPSVCQGYGETADAKRIYTRNYRGWYSYRAHLEDVAHPTGV
jgi:thymidylate synthase ThyX